MSFKQREKEEVNWMIAREIPALRRYAYTLMRDSDKKDDLVQDTLERAIKKSHTWRREGSIRSWLYRIQYSVFLNQRKKPHLREVAAQNIIEGSAASMSPVQEETLKYKTLLDSLNTLKSQHREVLLLVSVEGFSYDEAASIMNVPVGTVRSRLARARDELRATLRSQQGVGSAQKQKEPV